MAKEPTAAERWSPEYLDPESDQIRQVYAKYGLAMYLAQVLEHGLANLVVASQLGSSVRSNEAMQALWDELFGLTMGAQMKRVLKDARLSAAQIARLQGALRTRNFLAHDYFRERAAQFLSFSGRSEMIDELETMQAELRAADEELEPLTFSFFARWGITPERVQEELNRIRREEGLE
jgi:hypothetical protein